MGSTTWPWSGPRASRWPSSSIAPGKLAPALVAEIVEQLGAALDRGAPRRHHPPRSQAGQHHVRPGRRRRPSCWTSASRGTRRPSPEERLTRAGFFVGTLQYVAPETLSGELVNEQADVYSLATITYYLLTRRYPFTGKSPRELFQQLLTQPPVPLNQCGKGLRFPPARRGGRHARARAGSVQAVKDGGRIRPRLLHRGAVGGPARRRDSSPSLFREGQGLTEGAPVRLRRLLLERSVRRGEFVLASGQRSSYYIDCRLTTMCAEGHGAHRARWAGKPFADAGWRPRGRRRAYHGRRPGGLRHRRRELRHRSDGGRLQRAEGGQEARDRARDRRQLHRRRRRS